MTSADRPLPLRHECLWCTEMSGVSTVRVLRRRERNTPRGTIRGATILSCARKGPGQGWPSGNRAPVM